MPILWSGSPGRAVAFPDPAAPSTVRFMSMTPELTFESHTVIITRVAFSRGCNHQFMHSLGGLVHLYVMGDRVGQIQISGLAFASACNPISQIEQLPSGASSAGQETPTASGFDKILTYYDDNKLSARAEEIDMVIGNRPLRGYLHSINGQISNPELRITEFNLELAMVPERRRRRPLAVPGPSKRGTGATFGTSTSLPLSSS